MTGEEIAAAKDASWRLYLAAAELHETWYPSKGSAIKDHNLVTDAFNYIATQDKEIENLKEDVKIFRNRWKTAANRNKEAT